MPLQTTDILFYSPGFFTLLSLVAKTQKNAAHCQVLSAFFHYLAKSSCVKIYLNGHNHAGNYATQNGIHFVNLKGMVETENENAFSIISFSDKQIEIEGFGREENRILKVK